MGALAIPIVIIVVALVAAAVAFTRFTRAERAKADGLRADGQTLHYCVPNGYDPVDVVLELSRAGYEVVPDSSVGQSDELLIGGRDGQRPDRERIRQILAELTVPTDASGRQQVSAVRFMDE